MTTHFMVRDGDGWKAYKELNGIKSGFRHFDKEEDAYKYFVDTLDGYSASSWFFGTNCITRDIDRDRWLEWFDVYALTKDGKTRQIAQSRPFKQDAPNVKELREKAFLYCLKALGR